MSWKNAKREKQKASFRKAALQPIDDADLSAAAGAGTSKTEKPVEVLSFSFGATNFSYSY